MMNKREVDEEERETERGKKQTKAAQQEKGGKYRIS